MPNPSHKTLVLQRLDGWPWEAVLQHWDGRRQWWSRMEEAPSVLWSDCPEPAPEGSGSLTTFWCWWNDLPAAAAPKQGLCWLCLVWTPVCVCPETPFTTVKKVSRQHFEEMKIYLLWKSAWISFLLKCDSAGQSWHRAPTPVWAWPGDSTGHPLPQQQLGGCHSGWHVTILSCVGLAMSLISRQKVILSSFHLLVEL